MTLYQLLCINVEWADVAVRNKGKKQSFIASGARKIFYWSGYRFFTRLHGSMLRPHCANVLGLVFCHGSRRSIIAFATKRQEWNKHPNVVRNINS